MGTHLIDHIDVNLMVSCVPDEGSFLVHSELGK
jgi:hypothetical protein